MIFIGNMRTLSLIATAAGLVGVAYGAEQTCGTRLAPECPDGSFCSTGLGECTSLLGGLNTKGGMCKLKPDMCAQFVDPVCGCDGVDYSNECEANMKGVSVQSKGNCPKSGGLNNLRPGIGGNAEGDHDSTAAIYGTSTTDCGGPTAIKCAPDHVCIYEAGNECGIAEGSGHCEPTKDIMCMTDYTPVCGCDGTTYSNACVAQYQNGVPVRGPGTCEDASEGIADIADTSGGQDVEEPANDLIDGAEEVGEERGGGLFPTHKCTADKDCGLHGYCHVQEGGCSSKNPITEGVCAKKPLRCESPPFTTAFTAVCGCDGTTYPTECHAQQAGMSILYRGACFRQGTPAPADSCGGKGLYAETCNKEGYYCHYQRGVCSLHDSLGTCTSKPAMCTQEIDPVCGCNGKTYDNACKAAMAGSSIKSKGECPFVTIDDGWGGGGLTIGLLANVTGGPCKPSAGLTCSEGYYCIYAAGVCGSEATAEGLCVVQPESCVPDPSSAHSVCGCDGHSWATACDAAMAGVALKAETECPLVSVQVTSPAMHRYRGRVGGVMVMMTVFGMLLGALAIF